MMGFQYDYKFLISRPPSRQLDDLIHVIVGVPTEQITPGNVLSPVMPRSPRYSGDINAAMMLLASFSVWHITKRGDKHIIIDLWKDGKAIAYLNEVDIEEPALAICRAFLTWIDRIGR